MRLILDSIRAVWIHVLSAEPQTRSLSIFVPSISSDWALFSETWKTKRHLKSIKRQERKDRCERTKERREKILMMMRDVMLVGGRDAHKFVRTRKTRHTHAKIQCLSSQHQRRRRRHRCSSAPQSQQPYKDEIDLGTFPLCRPRPGRELLL